MERSTTRASGPRARWTPRRSPQAFRQTAPSAARRGRDPHQGRRVHDRPGLELRERVDAVAGGPRRTRRRARRHGRADVQQPPRVHPLRPGGDRRSGRRRSRSTTPTRRSRSSYVVSRRRREDPDHRVRLPPTACSRRARTLPELEHLIVLDGEAPRAPRARGASRARTPTSTSPQRSPRSSPTTSLTLIYTSGTTGPPKGVPAHPPQPA